MLEWLFESNEFSPHGFCLFWDPPVLWLHVASDALIALAYLTIPAVLLTVAIKRPDLNPFKVLFWFAGFIITCALTHLLAIVTLWEPLYALAGVAKASTALVSVSTAALVWVLLPRILTIPSHSALAAANAELTALRDSLETKVAQRTQDLQETNTRLQAAQQQAEREVAARTRLMRTISHELRTPLNAVIGFSELLSNESRERLSDTDKSYLEQIQDAGQLLLSLVNEVLEYQRSQADPEVFSKEPVDSLSVVDDAASLVAPLLRAKDLTLEIEVPEGLEAATDRRAALQIVRNLLSNAAKYTPEGGRIGVSGEECPAGPRLTIWDTGVGISKEDQQRMFHPFFRARATESMAQGTGLGLATVRRLAERLGWHLEVESALGSGTAIHLQLPCADREAAAAAALAE